MSTLVDEFAHELSNETGSWLQIMQIYGTGNVFKCLMDDDCCSEAKENASEEAVWALLECFPMDQLIQIRLGWAKKSISKSSWDQAVYNAIFDVVVEAFADLPETEKVRYFKAICAHEATEESGSLTVQVVMLQQIAEYINWSEDISPVVRLVAGADLLTNPDADEQGLLGCFRFLAKSLYPRSSE